MYKERSDKQWQEISLSYKPRLKSSDRYSVASSSIFWHKLEIPEYCLSLELRVRITPFPCVQYLSWLFWSILVKCTGSSGKENEPDGTGRVFLPVKTSPSWINSCCVYYKPPTAYSSSLVWLGGREVQTIIIMSLIPTAPGPPRGNQYP